MNMLEESYAQAIEQTKQKISEDINKYFEMESELPSCLVYLADRRDYLEQVWLNVWMNRASNDTPRKDKKALLRTKGIDPEGLPHKDINRLFRNELRDFPAFDYFSWIEEEFIKDPAVWKGKYEAAKKAYEKRKEEQLRAEERWRIRDKIQQYVQVYISEHTDLAYIYIRKKAADQIKQDFQKGIKYQDLERYRLEERLVGQGSFELVSYPLASSFFSELTGSVHGVSDWGGVRYVYETYYDRYERLIEQWVTDLIPEMILDKLPENLIQDFIQVFGEKPVEESIQALLETDLFDFSAACLEALAEEFTADLLRLADIPFEESRHLAIFDEDEQERERKQAEIEAEEERKRLEKERMMADIFGSAYTPPAGNQTKYVLHIGETNTGKTYQALKRMKEAESGLYLAPLRLLAFEAADKLNSEGIPCTLKTGEEEKSIPGARHMASTVEMFYEKDYYEVTVIDEAQMIADKDRGFSWYRAIMKANSKEVHIIGSWNIKDMLLNLLDEYDLEIYEYSRDTPLEVETKEFQLKDVQKGDALVCFSRRKVLETASRLQKNGHTVSMIYGSMPPETRQKQMERFNRGEAEVVVATDAIGMGLNLPIRRIVFLENEKFDGTGRRRLTSQEVKQIAGRAGRIGIYDIGRTAFVSDVRTMRRLLMQPDEPVRSFAIAPTSAVFERFQVYYRDLGSFFDLWEEFEPPKGTKKASLAEELERYEVIAGTEIEARFSIQELYGYLHLPFSSKEPALLNQWINTMEAVAFDLELPEPIIKTRTLEDLELSYKAIGLHLLFLYRLDRRTEAVYWERIREDISESVHDQLSGELPGYQRKCRRCGNKLPEDTRFAICEDCFHKQTRQSSRRRNPRRHERH